MQTSEQTCIKLSKNQIQESPDSNNINTILECTQSLKTVKSSLLEFKKLWKKERAVIN